jgi:hypothetical protein
MNWKEELEDVKYFQQKLTKALGIPKNLLNPGGCSLPAGVLRDAGIFVIEKERTWESLTAQYYRNLALSKSSLCAKISACVKGK